MSLAVAWHPAALESLYRMHWRPASAIDAAIMMFATSGLGHVERVPDRPMLRRLTVERFGALVQVDVARRTLLVLAVYERP